MIVQSTFAYIHSEQTNIICCCSCHVITNKIWFALILLLYLTIRVSTIRPYNKRICIRYDDIAIAIMVRRCDNVQFFNHYIILVVHRVQGRRLVIVALFYILVFDEDPSGACERSSRTSFSPDNHLKTLASGRR